jgi:hypothetical protein
VRVEEGGGGGEQWTRWAGEGELGGEKTYCQAWKKLY